LIPSSSSRDSIRANAGKINISHTFAQPRCESESQQRQSECIKARCNIDLCFLSAFAESAGDDRHSPVRVSMEPAVCHRGRQGTKGQSRKRERERGAEMPYRGSRDQPGHKDESRNNARASASASRAREGEDSCAIRARTRDSRRALLRNYALPVMWRAHILVRLKRGRSAHVEPESIRSMGLVRGLRNSKRIAGRSTVCDASRHTRFGNPVRRPRYPGQCWSAKFNGFARADSSRRRDVALGRSTRIRSLLDLLDLILRSPSVSL